MEKMLEIISDLRSIGDHGLEPAFRDFDNLDWCGFAGADLGSKIAHGDKYVFILSPNGDLTVIDGDGKETNLNMVEFN